MSDHFTAADVEEHQQRTLGGVQCTCGLRPTTLIGHSKTCPRSLPGYLPREVVAAAGAASSKKRELPQPVAMSRPEREMGMILEAKKRAGEIGDYRFQGMSLAYGEDPETGILLRYKCDYVVIEEIKEAMARLSGIGATGDEIYDPAACEKIKTVKLCGIKIIECKGHGKHAISAAAKLRFKGAKAAWPMFKFEMHQREQDGNWRRVL